jgi:hypothetical protein
MMYCIVQPESTKPEDRFKVGETYTKENDDDPYYGVQGFFVNKNFLICSFNNPLKPTSQYFLVDLGNHIHDYYGDCFASNTVHVRKQLSYKEMLKTITPAMIDEFYGHFSQIPDQFLTERIIQKHIFNPCYYKKIRLLPKRFRTHAFYLKLVKHVPDLFQYIPRKFKTKSICEAAVKAYPRDLEFVPNHLKTEKMCLSCVRRDDLCIKYVPQNMFNQKICELCVDWMIEYIPKQFWTQKLFDHAVKKSSYSIRFVPPKFQTWEMCMCAVKDGDDCDCAYFYMPEKFKTHELSMFVVENYGTALRNVPESAKTRDVCLAAVNNDEYALQYVPNRWRDKDMCETVFRSGNDSIQFIPERLRKEFYNIYEK